MRRGSLPSCTGKCGFCGNPGLRFAMVACLHQSNVYIKRKLLVLRIQKCIFLVGEEISLTCTGLQTTPSNVSRYMAGNGNMRNPESTFSDGTVFEPRKCLYQKEAMGM